MSPNAMSRDGHECDWRRAQTGLPRASGDAWRTAPAVRREYWRGYVHGVISVLTVALWLAMLALALYSMGFRP